MRVSITLLGFVLKIKRQENNMNGNRFIEVTSKFTSPSALVDAYHDGELSRQLVLEVLDFAWAEYEEDEITGWISLH